MENYFHEGELELQKKFNAWHDPKMMARLLKDHIVEHYVPFIENQSTVILSSTDEEENIWASMLIGEIGFIKVESPTIVTIDLLKLKTTKTDVFFKKAKERFKIGVLFIDTATRSRYRINGEGWLENNTLKIELSNAYPNCPKYIQQRIISLSHDATRLETQVTRGESLSKAHKKWIKAADTFFMASRNAASDMDASHRGGPIGFVEVLENGTLKIPDYVGNNLFNTLGNFVQYPKAALFFLDFEKGHSLQLSGAVQLLFDQESFSDMETTTGTGRYWLFKTEQWIQTQNYNKVDWKFIDFSPFNPSKK